jgi:hypothetical protein
MLGPQARRGDIDLVRTRTNSRPAEQRQWKVIPQTMEEKVLESAVSYPVPCSPSKESRRDTRNTRQSVAIRHKNSNDPSNQSLACYCIYPAPSTCRPAHLFVQSSKQPCDPYCWLSYCQRGRVLWTKPDRRALSAKVIRDNLKRQFHLGLVLTSGAARAEANDDDRVDMSVEAWALAKRNSRRPGRLRSATAVLVGGVQMATVGRLKVIPSAPAPGIVAWHGPFSNRIGDVVAVDSSRHDDGGDSCPTGWRGDVGSGVKVAVKN